MTPEPLSGVAALGNGLHTPLAHPCPLTKTAGGEHFSGSPSSMGEAGVGWTRTDHDGKRYSGNHCGQDMGKATSQWTRPADKASAPTCTPGSSHPPRCTCDHRLIMEDRQAQGSTETLEVGDGHISMDGPAIFRKSLQTWRLKVTEGTIPL